MTLTPVPRRSIDGDDDPRRYRRLFERAPDAQLVVDDGGRIQEANPRAAALLGLPVERLAGWMLASFVSPAQRRHLRNRLAAAGAAAGPAVSGPAASDEWRTRLRP